MRKIWNPAGEHNSCSASGLPQGQEHETLKASQWLQVFIRGANFITPDAMMRANSRRWQDEVAYHALTGFNMLRL